MAYEISHPLLKDKLCKLRDKNTSHMEFRQLVDGITTLIAYEALKDLETKEVEIETPVSKTKGQIVDHDIVLIPVLRAGVGMLNGVLNLFPNARVGFIGLYRDHETKQPVEYYQKLPEKCHRPVGLIIDPMLATGGSTNAAIDIIKKQGYEEIRILCVIAAPEGIQAVEEAHPDVPVYAGSIDDHLDENKYIVPGLGDAGDRLFGTK